MTAMFELVIINSSREDIVLTKETIHVGTSDVSSRSLLIPSKTVQRYKFKTGTRGMVEGEVVFTVKGLVVPTHEFVVNFNNLNNRWDVVAEPAQKCFKEFQRRYTLEGTTFHEKQTLSMAVELLNINY